MPSRDEQVTAIRSLIQIPEPELQATLDQVSVKRFVQAVGGTHSVPNDVVPITFLTTLIGRDQPLWYRDLEFRGMYHAREVFKVHRQPRIGDVLSWQSRVVAVREHTGRRGQRLWFVSSLYPFRGQAGERVVDVIRTRILVELA